MGGLVSVGKPKHQLPQVQMPRYSDFQSWLGGLIEILARTGLFELRMSTKCPNKKNELGMTVLCGLPVVLHGPQPAAQHGSQGVLPSRMTTRASYLRLMKRSTS